MIVHVGSRTPSTTQGDCKSFRDSRHLERVHHVLRRMTYSCLSRERGRAASYWFCTLRRIKSGKRHIQEQDSMRSCKKSGLPCPDFRCSRDGLQSCLHHCTSRKRPALEMHLHDHTCYYSTPSACGVSACLGRAMGAGCESSQRAVCSCMQFHHSRIQLYLSLSPKAF